MTPPAYLWVYTLFAGITIPSMILFGIAAALKSAGHPAAQVRQTVQSSAILLFGWLALAMLLGSLGIFQARADGVVPFVAIGIVVPIITGVLLIRRSVVARRIINAMPQTWLIGIQIYRGLGAMFLVLYGVGLLPGAFALPAGFGDVGVALLALPVVALYVSGSAYRDGFVAVWNMLGIADLVVAVASGFLSSPGPYQMLALGEPNYLISAYPLVMIPLFAVPTSIVLHIASLTKLAWQHDQRLLPAHGGISA